MVYLRDFKAREFDVEKFAGEHVYVRKVQGRPKMFSTSEEKEALEDESKEAVLADGAPDQREDSPSAVDYWCPDGVEDEPVQDEFQRTVDPKEVHSIAVAAVGSSPLSVTKSNFL